MAVQDYTFTEGAGKTYRHVWTITDGDTGDPAEIPGATDRTVQVTGTFGGTTITLQGSLEETPTNWFTLTDPLGNDVTFSAAGAVTIMENATWIRPSESGGSSVSVEVTLLSKSTV